jgi:hypothetical protein
MMVTDGCMMISFESYDGMNCTDDCSVCQQILVLKLVLENLDHNLECYHHDSNSGIDLEIHPRMHAHTRVYNNNNFILTAKDFSNIFLFCQ